MTDFPGLIRLLADAGVEFILVGGMAATVHGSARLTRDVDVVYARTAANIARLTEALSPHHPYLRGAPKGLPFQWDAATLSRGLNFTLTTRLGDLDLLGEVTGGGAYDQLLPHTERVRIFDRDVVCLALDWLIKVKRAAGRPRDLESVAELEAIQEERSRLEGSAGFPDR
jgi:predicted nucleotidyltransferase